VSVNRGIIQMLREVPLERDNRSLGKSHSGPWQAWERDHSHASVCATVNRTPKAFSRPATVSKDGFPPSLRAL